MSSPRLLPGNASVNEGGARIPASRIQSIDILRGAVMVLMAIDHVRVYSGLPAGGPTAGIFFTRWITHFCAPAFAFFAGTSAFLYGRKLADRGSLARYLVIRGLLLVVLELTVIRFTWTFNFDYGRFTLAGVIWMLGWCMVLLAGLVQLSPGAVGTIGLAIILFQQVFGMLPGLLPEAMRSSVGRIWEFVYPAGLKGWPGISVLYVLIPWIGVMAAGYGFGALLARPDRRRLCLSIGLSAAVLFLVAGGIALSSPDNGDPRPTLFRLLDQRKYPASQLYLLMTLGPVIALMPLAEQARNRFAGLLATFGSVPMFYYLLHIPAIHIAALAVNFLREGSAHSEWYGSAPFVPVPPDHRWSLPLLYLVWAGVVAALYPACRWFANAKARRSARWLKYI
jgi:uncharacterized membrane protein